MEQKNKNNECGGPKAECAARKSENEKKRVYISGPITGREREAVLYAFNDVRCYLEIMGFEVVLPIENRLPADASHAAHMRCDFGLLLYCDYIYLMEGWMESHGCVAEMFVAKSAGIKVLHNEEESKYKDCDVSLKVTIHVPHGVLSDVLGVDSVKFEEVPAEDECEDDTEE